MIEKFFELGVCYRWQKPPNVDGPRDGAIVDSTKPPTPLTYIGLGAVVSPRLRIVHVRMLGLQMNMQIPYKWLDYAPGRTAKIQLAPDVLTGFMSGCIIACWRSNRGIDVGHIGTVESDPATNTRVKRAFADAMRAGTIRGATGFNPLRAWDNDLEALCQRFNPPMVPKICALVTTTREFYSIVMFIDKGANEWYCGGAKKVPPMNSGELTTFLNA